MNNLFDTENQVLNPELIQKLNDLYDQGNLQLEKVRQNNVDYSLPIWNASKIMDSEVVNKLKETGSVIAYNHEKKTFEVIKIQGNNLGSGEGVYKDTKGIALQFKSIKGGKNAKVTTVGDELVIDAEYEYNDQGLKSLIDTKALKNHDHPIYATKPELKVLSNEVKTKADKSHEHQDYAKKDDLKALKTSIKIPKVDLSSFAKKTDLKPLVDRGELISYAKNSSLDLIVKESIKLNSNINSELKNYAKRDHLHDEYAKDADLKLLETKIPKDFATKKDIADLNYEKANLIHGHNTGQISGLTETLSGLGSTYLKIDGSNSMTSTTKITNLNADLFDGANLSIDGTFATNSDALIPSEKAVKTYVGTVASEYLRTDGQNWMTASITSMQPQGTMPISVVSTTRCDFMNVDMVDDAHLSIDGTFATNSDLLFPSEKAVRTFVGASLVLGSPANGLTLTGTTVKTLSLPTTAAVKLASLNVNSSSTPSSSQIYIPQGSGGASAPGLKFIPTDSATTGGLSMFSGIAEFWNNWDSYTTPQAGKMRGFFRLDSRTGGYEAEAFNIGGRLIGGSNYQGFALNFSTGDAILCGYELGSVGVGRPMSLLGVSGKNGWLATQYTVKVGGGLIMKYLAKTANYTLTETDYIVDCTANSFTITLPSAVTWAGQVFVIKNSGTGVITLNTTSSQTIDGNASGALTLALQYDSITVMSNGANWIII